MTFSKTLPAALAERLSGYRFERDTLGRSTASVFRLEGEGQPVLYLKVEAAGPFGELADEAARLDWLKTAGLPCPEVIGRESHGGRNWRLPITSCPFDHRREKRMAVAKARMQAGSVDETDFDETRLGKSAETLFAELESRRPGREDLVVTHGDACLPNFIASEEGFSGYIDCSRLGVADRYQDIALACRSIAYNFGEALVQPFLDRYGLPATDPARLGYYQLLDEFF